MRLITVRTAGIATLSAAAGICTAVALVKFGTAPEESPGVEVSSGTLTGRVTEFGSGIALENALVLLEDAGVRALTNAGGRYMLVNVSPGRHTVTIRNLGYAEQQQEVTVAEGQTTIADQTMRVQAIQLKDLVISSSAVRKE